MISENRIAIFDFDGTLTVTDSTKFLLLSLIIYKPFLIKKLYHFFLENDKQSIRFQMNKAAIIGDLIKNCSPKTLKKRLWFYKFLVGLTYRRELLAKLSNYRNQNYSIIIATASPTFAIRILFPNDTVVIGTEFSMKQNLYTGQTCEKVCFGQNKADAVSMYLKKRNITQAEIAFSDHSSDLPLLRCAKSAYIVQKSRLVAI